MEKYIMDSLVDGSIHPSSSPFGACFLFVEKKEKTLHSCIDFRDLHKISTITAPFICL